MEQTRTERTLDEIRTIMVKRSAGENNGEEDTQDSGKPGPRRLEVTVLSARHLPKMDTFGSIDPFCEVRLGTVSFKTAVKKNTYSPEWGESFVFEMADGPNSSQPLTVTLFDWDLVGVNDRVGAVEVSAERIAEAMDREIGWFEDDALLVLDEARQPVLGKDKKVAVIKLRLRVLDGARAPGVPALGIARLGSSGGPWSDIASGDSSAGEVGSVRKGRPGTMGSICVVSSVGDVDSVSGPDKSLTACETPKLPSAARKSSVVRGSEQQGSVADGLPTTIDPPIRKSSAVNGVEPNQCSSRRRFSVGDPEFEYSKAAGPMAPVEENSGSISSAAVTSPANSVLKESASNSTTDISTANQFTNVLEKSEEKRAAIPASAEGLAKDSLGISEKSLNIMNHPKQEHPSPTAAVSLSQAPSAVLQASVTGLVGDGSGCKRLGSGGPGAAMVGGLQMEGAVQGELALFAAYLLGEVIVLEFLIFLNLIFPSP